jgi:nucleoid-associated protein YgaU
MFHRNSRYFGLATVTATDDNGREVRMVKWRRLPAISGVAHTVHDSDQLDRMSRQRYRDATRYWTIGDANSELEVNELVRVSGRVIRVPER